MGDAYDNQHIVTQAILRRWAEGTPRRVEVYLRQSGLVASLSTSQVCSINGFINHDPARAERAWSGHETRLGDFYAAVENERLFDDPRALQTARTMLALHTARGYTVQEIAAVASALARERVAHELVERFPHELAASIGRRSMLFIPITYAVLLDEARRVVERNSGPMAAGGAFFRDRVLTHFRRARQLMKAQQGIEVFVSENTASEFVIGDDPGANPFSRDGWSLWPP